MRGFDAQIVYHDLQRADPVTEKALRASPMPLDDLLARSDIVSLHTPLNAATRRLIRPETLALMKPGALLINTARGELVDEEALHAALVSGRLAGAGLDTFDNELPAAGHPLLSLPQVTLTSHIGGGVFDNVTNVALHAFGNMRRVLAGQPLAPTDVLVPPPVAS